MECSLSSSRTSSTSRTRRVSKFAIGERVQRVRIPLSGALAVQGLPSKKDRCTFKVAQLLAAARLCSDSSGKEASVRSFRGGGGGGGGV